MFFIKPMEHTILLHPSYFGPNIQRYLRDRLYEDIEGKCTGDFYIIAIMDINDYSEGQVMPGSGFAQYNVHYRAIVWKPFKGEVLDGIVTKVVPNGFFVDIAAFTAFVSAHSMPTNMKYDGNATPPSFVEHTDQGPVEVAPQSQVRLRLSGIRAEVGQMWAVATINDDYLGPLPDEDEA